VADCVIALDHRIEDQVSTRRLRIVKYRGSAHGTNEYPFLIGARGISVLPVTSLGLDHPASTERVSSGIAALDTMLGGGVFRGASVLISGSSGTGKSSVGAAFVAAACARGERALIFAFEESEPQILRNLGSIGTDLAPCLERGLLRIHAARPTLQGLEQHLLAMHDAVDAHRPQLVFVDPVSNLGEDDSGRRIRPTLLRLIDFLKREGITAVFAALTHGDSRAAVEDSQVGISSLMDTWLLLRTLEAADGLRQRSMCVLKSRGTAHSMRSHTFRLSERGLQVQEFDDD
jgi:circadian clock protein KaiC